MGIWLNDIDIIGYLEDWGSKKVVSDNKDEVVEISKNERAHLKQKYIGKYTEIVCFEQLTTSEESEEPEQFTTSDESNVGGTKRTKQWFSCEVCSRRFITEAGLSEHFLT